MCSNRMRSTIQFHCARDASVPVVRAVDMLRAKPVQLASAGSTLPPMQAAAEQISWTTSGCRASARSGIWMAMAMRRAATSPSVASSGGLDYRLCPEMLVGLAVGYSHDNATVGGAWRIRESGRHPVRRLRRICQWSVASGRHLQLRFSPDGHEAVHQRGHPSIRKPMAVMMAAYFHCPPKAVTSLSSTR